MAAPASDDVLELWRHVAAAATAPAAIARFEDLLFEYKDGNRRGRAERAAEAYLQSAAAQFDYDGLEYLVRAWELARRVALPAIHLRARDIMAAHVEAVMSSAPGTLPGVVFPMLGPLAAGPYRPKGTAVIADPIDVDAMLQMAVQCTRKGTWRARSPRSGGLGRLIRPRSKASTAMRLRRTSTRRTRLLGLGRAKSSSSKRQPLLETAVYGI